MNYAYREQLPRTAFGPADTAEPAGREARLLLSSARTVAFYPPDYCINVDKDEVARSRTLRANCGVLLSSLERAAEKAGYEVLSWQNLRGTQRPIDYAREARVDVLFEINEFDFGPVDDSKLVRGMSFVSYPDGGNTSPFTPPQTIADRCTVFAAKRRKSITVAKVGTVDIKTVSVVDGRNRWRYRKSLTRPRDVEYERVAFGSVAKPNPGGVALGVIGAIGLGIGLGLFLGDYTTSDDPATPENEDISFGSVPEIMMVTGAIAFAGSFVVNALTSKAGSPDRMCAADSTVEPLVIPGRMPQVDEEAENAAIRSEMIGEFVNVIVDVRNSTPPAPVPAAAPPVEPAPPRLPAP
jgi:hypothetical protein